MIDSSEPAGPVIVCPLQFERKMLLRAGLGDRYRIECSGPGTAGVEAWAEGYRSAGRTVILAGLAGGLSDSCPAGSAHLVDRIVDATTGEDWTPTPAGAGIEGSGSGSCVLTSARVAVRTRCEKIALAERTGARVVDLESAAFARCAVGEGWRWHVVRGVSDDLETELPRGIDQWVDQCGWSRRSVVAASIARQPWLLPSVLRLRRCGALAMEEVARLILGLSSDWT